MLPVLKRTVRSLSAILALASSSLVAEVVINEIMYHPQHAENSAEPFAEEFIELHNTDPINAVDLTGWSFSSGLTFIFPPVSLPPGGFLLVAADPPTFAARYPGVTATVLGPWAGRLGNNGERVRLVDATNEEVDDLSYQDDGDWAVRRRGPDDNGHRGWRWESRADGAGSSLELQNPLLSNKLGQNWADSTAPGGTPGAANSVASTDVAPFITKVSHSPAVPSSSDLVRIRATLRDELPASSLTAKVHYRISSANPVPFTTVAMCDDGLCDDELPNDGVFAATLPAHADRTVIEFYVEARDSGMIRTWPGPTSGLGAQGANALYAVEDNPPINEREVYRLILSGPENNEFADGSFDTASDAQMNATFIASRGEDREIRYRAGLRRRGASSRNDNPRTMRLNLPGESPWDDVTTLNLNNHYSYLQILGHKLFAASCLPGGSGRSVKLFINGLDEAVGTDRDFGFYAHMEPQGTQSIDRQFPDDGAGNLYRKRRPDTQLAYRNGNLAAYPADGWSKNTNNSDWDWSDLDALMGALNDTNNPNYLEDLREHLDVEQWLRWFAVMTLLNNGETNISNGADDDYYMYRGVIDPRFKLIPHDLDTILGEGDGSAISDPQSTIYDMFEPGGNGRDDTLDILEPFIKHPEVLPRYHHHLRDLIETSFSKSSFDALVSECLEFVPSGQRANLISYMDQRRDHVRTVIDPPLSIDPGLGVLDGLPMSSSSSLATISGRFSLPDTAAVLVNGQAAQVDFASGTWSYGGPVRAVLIPRGADWKYLDDGSDQGTAWRAPGFDDSAWAVGAAPLGYGDGDEQTIVDFGGDPDNKHITTYFRHEFDVTDPGLYSSLQLLLQFDDGVAVYLNGSQIARENLALNAAYNEIATDFVAPENEANFLSSSAPATLLTPGSNTLAAEVHQFAADNPDLSFEFALSGVLPGPGLPLQPGMNRITAQTIDAAGGILSSETITVWYDDGDTQPLSGTLASNTTLSPADGPYLVTADLTVPSGVTLTIEAGTTIYFGPGTRLTVQGRLLAEGNEFQPVTLTREPGSGATWDGVYFSNTLEDNCMRFVNQAYSSAASHSVEVVESRLLLDHVTWTDTIETVLEISGPRVEVIDCIFPPTSGNEVIHGTSLSGDDYFILDGCFFNTSSGYNDIVDFSGGRRPGPIIQVRNNVFNGGTDDCLDLDGIDAHIEGNLFQNIHTDDPSRPSTSNAIATDGDAHITVVRNVFNDVDHALLLKNESDAIFENNVVIGATLGAISFREPLRGNVDAGSDIFARGNIFLDNAVTFRFPDHLRADGTPPNIVANHNIMPAAEHHYGTGNFEADPAFLDPAGGDFQLSPDSPARGTGIMGHDMGAAVPAGALLTGMPATVTASGDATILVHIAGISGIESGSFTPEYRWRLNNGAWSTDTPIVDPIALTGLTAGTYTVEAIAKDSAGVWQDENDAASLSWTVDPAHSVLRINEVLADNRTALDHAGTFPDYVELFNDGLAPLSLTGMGLTDDPAIPMKFTFPAMTLNGGEHLLLFGDDETTAPGLHLGFAIRSGGESLTLFAADGTTPLDAVAFGLQVADLSIGRTGPDATWNLNAPTPGTVNVPMGTANPARLRLNEWLAGSSQLLCDDFVELYNPGPSPVALGGLFFTDNPGMRKDRHPIHPLSFIGAGDFQIFWASNDPEKGPNHLSFALNANAEWIALYDSQLVAIDAVSFTGQRDDTSVGLFPDGGSASTSYPFPTPGLPNTQTGQAVTQTINLRALDDVWSFEQSDTDLLTAWREPAFDDSTWPTGAGLLYVEGSDLPGPKNTPLTLGASTYYFRSEFEFTGDPATTALSLQTVIDDGFVIHLNGEDIFRIGIDDPYTHTSNSTRAVGDAAFEGPFLIPGEDLRPGTNVIAAEVHQTDAGSSDIVFGLILDASVTTPGTPTPEFANALTLINSLRITELMFHPDDGSEYEFIELRNIGTETIDLTGVRFTDGIDFVFPAMTLAAGDYVLVVNDPGAFVLKYGPGLPVVGVYSGRLSNGGEEIALQLPEPYEVNIQKFRYEDSWYALSDGQGHSLEFIDPSAPISAWSSSAAWRNGALQGSPGSALFLSAGVNQVITHPATANLTGSTSASWTPSVQWTLFSGPGTVDFSAATSLNTTARFSLPGTYVLRLTGQADGVSLTSGVVITVDDTYEAWQARLGVAGGRFDNDDGDELLNIEEYAYERDPFAANPEVIPVPSLDQSGLGVTFLTYPRKSDVRVTLESSRDLIHWVPVQAVFLSGTPDQELLRYGIDAATSPQAFFRFSVGDLPSPPNVLVASDGLWHYRKGTNEPPADWHSAPDATLDASWEIGPGGFGYGDGDDRTVLADMQNNYGTLYTRRSFEITPAMDPARHLLLTIDYDDGCILYLDGEEVFRSPNIPGAPGTPYAFNQQTITGNHEAFAAGGGDPPVTIDLGPLAGRLGGGTHVLAAQGINGTLASSDLSLIVDLALVDPATLPEPPEDIVWSFADSPIVLTSDFTVDNGLTLRIEAGVEVILSDGVSLQAVNGSHIEVAGTSPAPVRFRSGGATDWGELSANGAGGSLTIRHAEISDGQVRFLNGVTGLLEDSTVRASEATAMVYAEGAAEVTLRRCHISDYEETNFKSTLMMIDSCLFEESRADAVDFDGAPPGSMIRQCSFRNGDGSNTDAIDIGPHANTPSIDVVIEDCIMHDFGDKGVSIGDAPNDARNTTVRNCLIYNVVRGVQVKHSATAVVHDCTIANSQIGLHGFEKAGGTGGGIFTDTYNNILADNGTAIEIEANTTIAVTHSNTQGLDWAGTGNINADPLFRDAASADYRLLPGSPCLGSGRLGDHMGVTFPIGGRPDIPGDLQVTAFDGNTAQLTWTDPDQREEDFLVERSSDGMTWTSVTTLPSGTTTATISNLDSAPSWEFRVRGANFLGASFFATIASPAPTPLDTDADGLPDAWEQLYFGSPTAADPKADSDGDGPSNDEEFVFESDPTDPTSRFIIEVRRTEVGAEITFPSSVNRLYTLIASDDPESGRWSLVGGQVDVPGTGTSMSLSETTGSSLRFYQVTVEVP